MRIPAIIHVYAHVSYCLVSGEANFTMHHTGLTVGGFTQPSVARNMLEHQPNIEKGLCQRFLWLVPKPNSILFEDFQHVDGEFFTAMGKYTYCSPQYGMHTQLKKCPKLHAQNLSTVALMASLWAPDARFNKWILPRPCEIFKSKYNTVNTQITAISCADDLLSGI